MINCKFLSFFSVSAKNARADFLSQSNPGEEDRQRERQKKSVGVSTKAKFNKSSSRLIYMLLLRAALRFICSNASSSNDTRKRDTTESFGGGRIFG